MIESFLLAIYPFDDTEKKLTGFKELLFKDHGLESALALPPVIPLCYLPGDLNCHAISHILVRHRQAVEWKTTDLLLSGNGLFLGVTGGRPPGILAQTLEPLILATRRITPRDTLPFIPFPVKNGFFLAVNQQGLSCKEMPAPHQIITISSFRVVVMIIRSGVSPECWWQDMEWEIVTEVKFK